MFDVRRSAFATVSSRAAAACMLAALAACGGGGGGSSGGGSLTPATFTSWGALPTNTPVTIDGMSVTRAANGTVSSDDPGSTASVLYNSRASAGLRGMTLTTPSASTSWTISGGSTIGCSAGVCALANPAQTNLAAVSDPYAGSNAWSYQSFGAWSIPSGGGSAISAMSYGAPTAGSAIPTSGTATYTGSMTGRYVAAAGDFLGVPAGTQFGVGASLQADVDFGARQIDVSTSGTAVLRQGDAPPPLADVRFNIVTPQTLTYAAGSNAFSGNIASGSNGIGLSGTVNGRFYGPAGQELGGTMSLSTAGGGALIGAFGAKCTAGGCP